MPELTALHMNSLLPFSIGDSSGVGSETLCNREGSNRLVAADTEGSRMLPGLAEATLDDRDSGRFCKGTAGWPLLIDLRCLRVCNDSSVWVSDAAAAETPPPPCLLALFCRSVASSKTSFALLRFVTGGLLIISGVSRGCDILQGRNFASKPPSPGKGGGVGSLKYRSEQMGRACTSSCGCVFSKSMSSAGDECGGVRGCREPIGCAAAKKSNSVTRGDELDPDFTAAGLSTAASMPSGDSAFTFCHHGLSSASSWRSRMLENHRSVSS